MWGAGDVRFYLCRGDQLRTCSIGGVVSSDVIYRLAAAVAALPASFSSSLNRRETCREFEVLIDLFLELFSEKVTSGKAAGRAGRDYARAALVNGLCYTGLPNGEGIMRSKTTPMGIAAILAEAAVRTTTKIVHLCPLDMADCLPAMRFGPCSVRRFSSDEFEVFIQGARLRRQFPKFELNCSAFSRFDWLVVEEEVTCPDAVGKRSFPWVWLDLSRDLGSIKPHPGLLPEKVERAVFTLLLLPQEDAAIYPDMNWRNFNIPWVYSVTDDPFQSPNYPKGHDTLTWEPDFFFDESSGEEIETEKPTRYPVDSEKANSIYSELSDNSWHEVESAMATSAFNPLIVHFLVRAFMSEGIDEFLGHISAIEAALGMKSDHDQRARPRLHGKNPGATIRIANRLSVLLKTSDAGQVYSQLFGIRSDFLHGRPVGEISSAHRLAARRLARETSSAIVDATIKNANLGRDEYLSSLCP